MRRQREEDDWVDFNPYTVDFAPSEIYTSNSEDEYEYSPRRKSVRKKKRKKQEKDFLSEGLGSLTEGLKIFWAGTLIAATSTYTAMRHAKYGWLVSLFIGFLIGVLYGWLML
jgi:hypothetical protein